MKAADSTNMRMWEIIPQEDGTLILEGVIKGPPAGVRTGDCYIPVDKTIKTSPITLVSGSHVETQNGGVYWLEGKSRPQLILEAFEPAQDNVPSKPCVYEASPFWA